MTDDLKPTGASPNFYVKSAWRVVRLWAIAELRSEKNRPDLPLLSVFLNRGVIAYSDGGGQVHKPGLDLSIYQVVRRGDLVLNNQQAWRGSVGVSQHEGIISPAYVVLALSQTLNPRFADYLFQSRDMVAQYVTSSKGVGDIQRDIHAPWLKNVKVPIPPPAEQVAIIRFLDWANGRLERAIRTKRKMTILLNEQKQAIIHQAITRGLDSSVSLKPSGVPWLGDIPLHWEVVRSRRLFSARKDLAFPGDVQLSATQMYGVIPQQEFERRVGRRVVKIFMHLEKRKHVERDDFVMSMRSFQGGLERAWAAGAIRSSYVVLKPADNVDVDFFAYVFKSPGYIGALQATSNFIRDGQDLTERNFRQVDLPLIPLKEQAQIASYIAKATARSVQDAAHLEREIELLREYRTRLVADVVTGKLDVREAAARLPEEVPPVTTEDDVDLTDETEPADEEAMV